MTNFASREDLDQALPHVMAAPRDDGPVDMLCYRPQSGQRVFSASLRLSRSGGVEGDYEMSRPWLKLPDGSPDPRIQVSILPSRVLNLVWRDRDQKTYPGDTVIADLDLSLENLPTGALIRAGTALLRVSDVWNDGCIKWKMRCGRPAYDWVRATEHEALRLRGIFCSIEADGDVAVGDRIVRL